MSHETYNAVNEFVTSFGNSGNVVRGNLKYYTNKGFSGVINKESVYKREDRVNGESIYGAIIGYTNTYSIYATKNGSKEDFITIFRLDNYLEDNDKLGEGFNSEDFQNSIQKVKEYIEMGIEEYESKPRISNKEVEQALLDFENKLKH